MQEKVRRDLNFVEEKHFRVIVGIDSVIFTTRNFGEREGIESELIRFWKKMTLKEDNYGLIKEGEGFLFRFFVLFCILLFFVIALPVVLLPMDNYEDF